ncbi:MAG: serine--tRNA ligase [Bacillota bacterium]|nr:serine--tRNA ligase [Bacillota bacterium]
MLDIRGIRADPQAVRVALQNKKFEADIQGLLELDERWRAVLGEVEQKRARKNVVSARVAKERTSGRDGAEDIAAMREVNEDIRRLEAEVRELEADISARLLQLPNLPHPGVPVGPDETANPEISRHGTPPQFRFQPLAHWDLGVRLGILDFERGAKVGGARAVMYRGAGAHLERALINLMLDLHVREHGYHEIYPPYLVTTDCMTGTGQLPKFGQDSFRIEGSDLWLNPTAEVPGTNMYRDEILDEAQLPLNHIAYATSFRSEIGSYGRDTKGLIRLHQFNKVEMLKWTTPETSYAELQNLLSDAGDVLKRLGLTYRIVEMCTGDLGFSASQKYDLEVWLPSYDRYVEISSCSNFEDFQARRMNTRYRPAAGGRVRYVHTLNGSGLAVGRTVAAVLENYQQADGTVRVPEALRPYMGGLEVIGPR